MSMNYIINSNQNKLVKHLKALQQRKIRDEYCEYLVEGLKMSYEALSFNEDISFAIFIEEYINSKELNILYKILIEKSIKTYIISSKLFKEVSETENPQGVILVIKKRDYTKEIDFSKEKMRIAILDCVKDPGNVGTIIRTADAFNLDAIFLSKGCVDLYNGKTIRSTMGSIFHIPLVDNIDLGKLLNDIKKSEFILMGADPYGNMDIREVPRYNKVAIVIGSESHGISETVRELLDITFKIPMSGKAESLNAGVAAAISMYEMFLK